MKPWLLLLACLGCFVGAPLRAATLSVSDATAERNRSVEVRVILNTADGDTAVGVEADLMFEKEQLVVAASADGRPNCTVNPAIDKGASGFSYRPFGCDAPRGECSAVHSVVLALDNLDVIPSGSQLYQCRIAVRPEAAIGRHPLRLSDALISAADGSERAATPQSGTLTVLESQSPPTPAAAAGAGSGCSVDAQASPPPYLLMLSLVGLIVQRARWRRRWQRSVATVLVVLHAPPGLATVRLQISGGSGFDGGEVVTTVRLHTTGGEPVAAVEAEVLFDPAATPMRIDGDGRPACAVNAALGKESTRFGWRPIGCEPGAGQCDTVHALVISIDNVALIPNDSALYECRVNIARNTPPGSYELRILNAAYASPQGADFAAAGSDAVITVLGAATPTAAPQPTLSQAPTPTVRGGDADCDGRYNAADVALTMAAIFGAASRCDADCNRDGGINAADVACASIALGNQMEVSR